MSVTSRFFVFFITCDFFISKLQTLLETHKKENSSYDYDDIDYQLKLFAKSKFIELYGDKIDRILVVEYDDGGSFEDGDYFNKLNYIKICHH